MLYCKKLIVLTCTINILFLNVLNALRRNIEYDRSTEFDGRVCSNSDVVLKVNSDSEMSCLALCSGKRCATVFYNMKTQVCTGCYTWYTSSVLLSPESGSRAYVFHFDCAGGQGRYNTSCYLRTSNMKWSNAKTFCASTANQFLAVPETIEEFSYISDWMKSKGLFTFAYLGVSDAAKEGKWRTIHGEKIGYTKWAWLEPNNGGLFSAENYLAFNMLGFWYDLKGDQSIYSVCERDMIAM